MRLVGWVVQLADFVQPVAWQCNWWCEGKQRGYGVDDVNVDGMSGPESSQKNRSRALLLILLVTVL